MFAVNLLLAPCTCLCFERCGNVASSNFLSVVLLLLLLLLLLFCRGLRQHHKQHHNKHHHHSHLRQEALLQK
jgi:fumarate reductase subunit D